MHVIERLAAFAGEWRGTNRLHDPRTREPEDSPGTATVTLVPGGRFWRVDYTWGYHDIPQFGSLLVGYDPKTMTASAHWIDTWHMGHALMAMTGEGHDNVFAVTGAYAAPPGPDWHWRIELDLAHGDTLEMTMTNIAPDGTEAPAAEATYVRMVR